MVKILSIAICDDEQIFLTTLINLTKEYFDHCPQKAEIFPYSNGNTFLESLADHTYDLILLDIDMPGKSGIEISETIRNQGNQAAIIFITNHESYVFQSFQYQPLRFIRKDHLNNEFNEAMKAYYDSYIKTDPLYTFTTAYNDVIIPIKEIIYLEVYNHNLTVYTTKEKLQIRKSLNFFEKEFEPYGFIRVHQSYLVSSRYIYSINATSLILSTKDTLPVSRGKNEWIKSQYMKYMRQIN